MGPVKQEQTTSALAPARAYCSRFDMRQYMDPVASIYKSIQSFGPLTQRVLVENHRAAGERHQNDGLCVAEIWSRAALDAKEKLRRPTARRSRDSNFVFVRIVVAGRRPGSRGLTHLWPRSGQPTVFIQNSGTAQNWVVDTPALLRQYRAMLGETENQFSLTRAALMRAMGAFPRRKGVT
jgi:hypothetical protein